MGWFSLKKDRPDAGDVAIRAVILRCVVSYAGVLPTSSALSNEKKWWTPAETKAFLRESERERDLIWSELGSLKKHLSPVEKAFSRMTPETVTDREIMNGTWRAEALAVILWSLGVVDRILPLDETAGPDLMGHFWKLDVKEFVRGSALRPREEIDVARDIAESWHWRSRTRQLIEEGAAFPDSPHFSEAGLFSFDDIVRQTVPLHEAEGTFAAIDQDFPAFGKAYRDLSDDEWSTVRSITMERHFALNWICGYAPGHKWDETPTDT